MMSFRSASVVAAICAVVAMVGVACGDDDDDTSSVRPAATEPTGPPIEIGFVNTENSPAGSYPEIRIAAEAAVQHINRDLGGVAGRPLQLESCVTNGSPESTLGCVNGFVQSGVVAVVPGVVYGTAPAIPPLTEAGIPYVGGLPTDSPELTAPNSFSFIGASPSALAALSTFIAEDLDARKASILYVDIPTGKLGAEMFSQAVLNNLGVTDVKLVPEGNSAADFTAALTAANEGDPDAILVLFGGSACSRIMQASVTLGIPASRMVYPQTCSAPEQLEAGGAGAKDAYFNTPFLPVDAEDADVTTYLDAMKKYAADTDPGQTNAQAGFSSIMNLYGVLGTLGGDITAKRIIDALRASTDAPNFMAHPYTCNGQAVPGLPAPCNANERIVQYDGERFRDVKNAWLNGTVNLVPR